MATSAASKKMHPAKGSGGIVGAIVPPKKLVDNFPLMTYLANNCTFPDYGEDSSLENEENLKAASNRRVEEMLNEAALTIQAQSKESDDDEDARKEALQLIHSLEWSRNQQDTWKVAKPQLKNEPDYRGFLHPIERSEDEYFSGTRKLKQPKERKRCRSDEVRLLDNGTLVLKNGSNELTEVAQLPLKLNLVQRSKSPRVPSVGLPFTPGPPPSTSNNAWYQGSGSALFSDARSSTVVADGVDNFNEQMAIAIAESLRTAKEEQQRYVNLRAMQQYDSQPLPKGEPSRQGTSDPPKSEWDDSCAQTQFPSTAGPQTSSTGFKNQVENQPSFYPRFDRIEKAPDANSNTLDNSQSLEQRSKYSLEREKSSKSPPPPANFQGTVHSVSDSGGKIVTLKVGPPSRNSRNSRSLSEHQNSNGSENWEAIPEEDESPAPSTCSESSSKKPLQEEAKAEFKCSHGGPVPGKSTLVPETFSVDARTLKQPGGNEQNSDAQPSDNQVKESLLPDTDKPSRLPKSKPALMAAMKTFYQSTSGNSSKSDLLASSDQSVDGHFDEAKESNNESQRQAVLPDVPLPEPMKFMEQAPGIGSSNPSVANVTHSMPCSSEMTASASTANQPREHQQSPAPAPNDNSTDLSSSMASQMLLQMLLMNQAMGCVQPPILQNQNVPGLNSQPNQFLNNDHQAQQGQTATAPNNYISGFPGVGNNLPAGLFGTPNMPLAGLHGLPVISSVPGLPQPFLGAGPGPLPGGIPYVFPGTVPGGFANGFPYGFPNGLPSGVPSHNYMTSPGLQGQNAMTGGFCAPSTISGLQQNSLASMHGLQSNIPVVPNPFASSLPGMLNCNSSNGMLGASSQPGNTPLVVGKGRGRLNRPSPP